MSPKRQQPSLPSTPDKVNIKLEVKPDIKEEPIVVEDDEELEEEEQLAPEDVEEIGEDEDDVEAVVDPTNFMGKSH